MKLRSCQFIFVPHVCCTAKKPSKLSEQQNALDRGSPLPHCPAAPIGAQLLMPT